MEPGSPGVDDGVPEQQPPSQPDSGVIIHDEEPPGAPQTDVQAAPSTQAPTPLAAPFVDIPITHGMDTGAPVQAVTPSSSFPGPIRNSGMAIASRALGFCGVILFIPAPVGLVLGLLAVYQIKASRGKLGGMEIAVTGIVVSTLASLLAVILLPIFAAARERARSATCMNNLKQIGVAITAYTQDYDERYPPEKNWCDAIYPLIKVNSVYQCPDLAMTRSSYSYNTLMDRIQMSKIVDPAKSVLTFDAKGGGWNLYGGPELVDLRHWGVDTANVAFADGHVKAVKSKGDHFESTSSSPSAAGTLAGASPLVWNPTSTISQ